MTESIELRAEAGRLDQVLSHLTEQSRAQVQHWISDGRVSVAGTVQTKAGFKLKGGEVLTVVAPPVQDTQVLAENIDLEVIYEDATLIAINKPPQMVTHPAPGVYSGTLVNALMGRMTLPEAEWSEEGYRPGIVHRLDRDTSGVIVVAKTVEAHAVLAEAFKERETTKTYIAIGTGKLDSPIRVDAPVGRHPQHRQQMTVNGLSSREAQTTFIPLQSVQGQHGQWYTLIRCEPRTGRTHQIRVHLQHLKCPILGDTIYGRESLVISRQALHAWKLVIPHPQQHAPLALQAALPLDMIEAWVALGGTVPPELLS